MSPADADNDIDDVTRMWGARRKVRALTKCQLVAPVSVASRRERARHSPARQRWPHFPFPSVSFRLVARARPARPSPPPSPRVARLRARAASASYEPTDRVSQLQNEGAYAVLAAATELEREGRDIVHLEIGQPGFPSPEHVVEAGVDAIRGGKTKYSSPDGTPALREAIADYVTRTRDVPVTPDEVVVGPGAKPGLFFPTLALVQPGDEVIYPDPGFPTYRAMIQVAGAVPVPVPLRPDGASFDMDAFRAAITPATKLIVLNSPANPTGGVMPSDDVEEVARVATENDAWVLRMRSTADWCTRRRRHPRIGTQRLLDPRHARSYGARGRIQQDVLHDRMAIGMGGDALRARRVELLVVHSVGCTATFTQEAGLAALVGPQEGVDAMVEEYRRRRDFVVGALNDIPGVSCPVPEGAFYAFPDVSSFGTLVQGGGGQAVERGRRRGTPGDGLRRERRGEDSVELRGRYGDVGGGCQTHRRHARENRRGGETMRDAKRDHSAVSGKRRSCETASNGYERVLIQYDGSMECRNIEASGE